MYIAILLSVDSGSLRRHVSMRNSRHVKMKNYKNNTVNQDVEANKTENRLSFNGSLKVHVDGPFGSPSSNIFSSEHAVLISTGIGVTPFASILQSIMYRYQKSKVKCPNCQHNWTNMETDHLEKLKKVDFIWVNRNHKMFEWFVDLLSQLENEQLDQNVGNPLSR